MRDIPQYIAVSMGWRLPDESRVKVIYQTRVISYEYDKDRWLVVLEQMTEPAILDGIAEETRSLLTALRGKWAYVPDEARNGTVLPLKYETLTGRIRFFYTQDPREKPE